MAPLPPKLEAEREALLREIDEAFGGVRRDDGVSWKESGIIDDYGTIEQCLVARASDPERGWRTLIDDPSWDQDSLNGGFNFLDAKGFRYYLAPAMVTCVRWGEGHELAWKLDLDETRSEYRLAQWSLLDTRQRLCVRRFLIYMAAADKDHEGKDWKKALASYWISVEEVERKSRNKKSQRRQQRFQF